MVSNVSSELDIPETGNNSEVRLSTFSTKKLPNDSERGSWSVSRKTLNMVLSVVPCAAPASSSGHKHSCFHSSGFDILPLLRQATANI